MRQFQDFCSLRKPMCDLIKIRFSENQIKILRYKKKSKFKNLLKIISALELGVKKVFFRMKFFCAKELINKIIFTK